MTALYPKSYIITGATSGMGRAIALRFAKEGARLILNGRNQERGEEVVDLIRQSGAVVFFVQGDVSLPSTNEALVEAALTHFGQLDGVLTNAGSLGLGKVTELPVEDWLQTFNTNVHSTYYLAKYALPHLMQQKGAVFIVNASIAAFKSFPNHPAYCASKAALVALTQQMALDYSPTVRFNTICPGPVDTPMIWDSAKAFPDPAVAVEKAGAATLLNRLGTPEDIANLAFFLASEQSSWMTGGVIRIDGGG